MKRIIFAIIISIIFVALVADEEIVSQRTIFSKTYNLENNQFRTELHCNPIHYRDIENNLVAIDFNEENSDSLAILAWQQALGRESENFDPHNYSDGNGIQACYGMRSEYGGDEFPDTTFTLSGEYFGIIDNPNFWNPEYSFTVMDSVIQREYNQYHIYDTWLDFEGCEIYYSHIGIGYSMNYNAPEAH